MDLCLTPRMGAVVNSALMKGQAMYQNQQMSVVFPAYNEADNIAVAVQDFLDTEVVDEVIVVDNNLDDGTAALAESGGAVIVHESK